MPTSRKRESALESVKIDNHIKELLFDGIRKAGSRGKLAEILGYSSPSNIIYQFMSAPRLRQSIPAERVEKLRKFLQA